MVLALNEAARSYVHEAKQWSHRQRWQCYLHVCCFDRSERCTKTRIGKGNARGMSAKGAGM